MTHRLLIPVLLAAAMATAVPASAQVAPPRPRPERPTNTLFGGGYGKTSQQLMLGVSFSAGYDDDLLAASNGGSVGVPNTAPRSGTFTQAGMSLDYSLNRDRVSANLSAGTSGRYYPDIHESTIGAYAFGAQISYQATSRTSLSSSQQFTLQPNTQSVLSGSPFTDSDLAEPTDPLSYAISRTTYRSLRSAVDLSQKITEHLSFNAGYQYFRSDSVIVGLPQYQTQTARAGLAYGLGQGVSLRLGYSFVSGQNATVGSGQYQGRSFDGGVDFSRAISLTRRTNLTFATGVNGIQDLSGQTRYFWTGNVSLARELGRSWTATAGYHRGVDFSQGLGQPVLSGTATAAVSGGIGRRLTVSSGAAYGRGVVGLGSGGSPYATWTGSLGLQVGLTRELGLGLNYGYYYYLFDSGPLPAGLAPEINRQSLQLSLNWRVPLMMRARRPNASR